MPLVCPRCNSTYRFCINATTDVEVSGETEYVESHHGFFWNENSTCYCMDCDYEDKVKEFEQGEFNGKLNS